MIKDKQTIKYLEEAKISLRAARSLYNMRDEKMNAHIVKNCYDSMEQAVSAALAKKDKPVPKKHPAKITEFVNSYSINGNIKRILFFWLKKRGSSQYVDVRGGEVVVPHEIFSKEDAEKAISDCEDVINYIEELINKYKKEKNE